jgi:hypothetical protein
MQSHPSNPSRLASWLAATMAALCLIASGQASAQNLTTNQQSSVTNLINASSDIKKQVAIGTAFSAGFAAAAANGTIVDPSAYQYATISEQQRTAYNTSMSTFSATDFYTAKQFLQQQAAVATANMQDSISSLASAAVDLQKAATVNQMMSAITDAPTAKSTQTAIATAGLNTEVTTQQVSAYNTSLASVNSYASQAATFFRAANNTNITGSIDTFKATYNKDLSQAYAVAGYNSANPYVTVGWQDGLSIGQAGMMTQYTQSSEAFYQANDPFAPR